MLGGGRTLPMYSFCGARVTFRLQFVVDVELVWSNALLYNKDPSHLVYVDSPPFLFPGRSRVIYLTRLPSGIKLLFVAGTSFGAHLNTLPF